MWGQHCYRQSPGYSPYYSYGDMYIPPPCNQEEEQIRAMLELMAARLDNIEEGVNKIDENLKLVADAYNENGSGSIIPDLVEECEEEEEELPEVYVYNTVHHELIDPWDASESNSDSDWDDVVKPIQLVPRIIPESWHEWESFDIAGLWPNDVQDMCFDEELHDSRELLHIQGKSDSCGDEERHKFYVVHELPPVIPRQEQGKEVGKLVLSIVAVPLEMLHSKDQSSRSVVPKNWKKKKKKKRNGRMRHVAVNNFYFFFTLPYTCSLEKRQREKRWWKQKKWREKQP